MWQWFDIIAVTGNVLAVMAGVTNMITALITVKRVPDSGRHVCPCSTEGVSENSQAGK